MMALRVDQRTPTAYSLDTYNKVLALSKHVLSVAKPKEPKPNNKHVPKRFVGIANMMTECVVEIGADILEANEIYVGANVRDEILWERYKARIALEEEAKRKTYRLEHIFRMLYYEIGFADSTATYMIDLIGEVRAALSKWTESDKRAMSGKR